MFVQLASWPADQPDSSLAYQKLWCWIWHANCSTKSFHTCHANRHHCLLPFCTIFTNFWLCLRVTSLAESKTYWLHFLLYLFLIRMKFGVVMKQFKLNILRLFFRNIFWKREIKKLKGWLAWGCLQISLIQIWYDDRYCFVIYILILVWSTLTLIQGHSSATMFFANYFFFNGIWYSVETCWCDEPNTHFRPVFSFFFCVPSYISWFHHFGWDFFVCDRFLKSSHWGSHISSSWMLSVFLLSAFTHLGQFVWWNACVQCTD